MYNGDEIFLKEYLIFLLIVLINNKIKDCKLSFL